MQHTRFHRRPAIGTVVAAAALAWAASALPLSAQESKSSSVTCRVRDDVRGRVFTLRRAESRPATPDADDWVLSMREAESRDTWITLALPGAKPVIAPPSAALSYRNANGGRQVDLSVTPSGSRLEVWVDYGLEVNIEPDLDPRVDRLTTDGPLTRIDCTIE